MSATAPFRPSCRSAGDATGPLSEPPLPPPAEPSTGTCVAYGRDSHSPGYLFPPEPSPEPAALGAVHGPESAALLAALGGAAFAAVNRTGVIAKRLKVKKNGRGIRATDISGVVPTDFEESLQQPVAACVGRSTGSMHPSPRLSQRISTEGRENAFSSSRVSSKQAALPRHSEDKKLTESMRLYFMTSSPPDVKHVVERFLNNGADPDIRFPLKIYGIDFLSVCPLMIATTHKQIELVKALVDAKGDVQRSCYSKAAGASGLKWEGLAPFAALTSDDLELLMHFVEECELDFNQISYLEGKAAASLLWNAAYFGAEKCLRYLIEKRANIEAAAESQDNSLLSYTPLHVAARAGKDKVCKILLDGKANIRGKCDVKVHDIPRSKYIGHWFFTPLDDAVEQSHLEVVKLLLKSKAKLVSNRKEDCSHIVCKDSSSSGNIERIERYNYTLQALFTSKNSSCIGTVAECLKDAPRQVKLLTFQDVVRFLETPGSAPVEIMKALFHRRPHIRYWKANDPSKTSNLVCSQEFILADNEKKRMWAQSALIRLITVYGRQQHVINFTEGPSNDDVEKHFKDPKSKLKDDIPKFVDRIAPQPGNATARERFGSDLVLMPVDFYVCLIPNLHRLESVLRAIAKCPSQAVFGLRECEAIVTHSWYAVRYLHMIDLGINFCISLILLLAVSALRSRETSWCTSLPWHAAGSSVFLMASLVLRLGQARGHWQIGGWREMVQSNFLGLLQIFFSIYVFAIFGLTTNSDKCEPDSEDIESDRGFPVGFVDSVPFRSCVFILVFVRWLHFFVALRLWSSEVNMIIQPIMTALIRSAPFGLAVLSFTFMMWECFWCFNIPELADAVKALTIAVRFSLLADFDMNELEGVDGTWSNSHSSNTWEWDEPEPTSYYYVIRIMLVSFGLMFPVLIMNILISVLSVWLDYAIQNVWLHFQQSRATMVLDYKAMLRGLGLSNALLEKEAEGGGLFPSEAEETCEYLWFSAPKNEDIKGEDAKIIFHELEAFEKRMTQTIKSLLSEATQVSSSQSKITRTQTMPAIADSRGADLSDMQCMAKVLR